MRKERGQEESAGSTTEVLTEGIEGLRLHLFRPSTLPAGPRQNLSLLLASVMGARASPSSSAHSTSSLLAGERRGNAGGSICRGLAAVSAARLGTGVAGSLRLSHGGLTVVDHGAAHHTSHASWSGSLHCKQRLMTTQHTHAEHIALGRVEEGETVWFWFGQRKAASLGYFTGSAAVGGTVFSPIRGLTITVGRY